jgi:hypothetical protein
MKTQIFHHTKNITFQKSFTRNQKPKASLQGIIIIIIITQVSLQAKISSFKKSKIRPIINDLGAKMS